MKLETFRDYLSSDELKDRGFTVGEEAMKLAYEDNLDEAEKLFLDTFTLEEAQVVCTVLLSFAIRKLMDTAHPEALSKVGIYIASEDVSQALIRATNVVAQIASSGQNLSFFLAASLPETDDETHQYIRDCLYIVGVLRHHRHGEKSTPKDTLKALVDFRVAVAKAEESGRLD